MISEAFCLVFLGISGITDYRRKSVPLLILTVFGLAGIILRLVLKTDIRFILTGIIPGAAMVLISLATAGKVGIGDGFAILVVGIMIGFWECLLSLTYGLMMSGAASLVLLAVKKNNRYMIPFLPFLLAGYVLWLATEILS